MADRETFNHQETQTISISQVDKSTQTGVDTSENEASELINTSAVDDNESGLKEIVMDDEDSEISIECDEDEWLDIH